MFTIVHFYVELLFMWKCIPLRTMVRSGRERNEDLCDCCTCSNGSADNHS